MGLLFFILVVGLVLIVPMPRTVKSTFVLAPGSSVELTAPRDGTISEVSSTTGAIVAKGSIIAKFDVSEAEKKIPVLELQISIMEKPAVRANPKVAKAAVVKAEAALKAAEAAVAKAKKAAKAKKTTPAMVAAEKKRVAAAAEVEKARAAVGMSREEVDKLLAADKVELAAAKAVVATGSLLAPGSGVLTLVDLEKGRAVAKGARIAVVEETARLKAMVKVPAGEEVLKGQGVELVLPSGGKRVLFDADARNDVAEAEFDNARGEFTVGLRGDANIEGTQRSLVSR